MYAGTAFIFAFNKIKETTYEGWEIISEKTKNGIYYLGKKTSNIIKDFNIIRSGEEIRISEDYFRQYNKPKIPYEDRIEIRNEDSFEEFHEFGDSKFGKIRFNMSYFEDGKFNRQSFSEFNSKESEEIQSMIYKI
jgi:hypothetical protein